MYSAVKNVSVREEKERELLSCYTCYECFHFTCNTHWQDAHIDQKRFSIFTSEVMSSSRERWPRWRSSEAAESKVLGLL